MPEHDDYTKRKRKRRRYRALRRASVLFVAVFAILGIAWAITGWIENSGQSLGVASSGVQVESEPDVPAEPDPEPEPPPVNPAAVDNASWNFIGTVPQTINNIDPITPDARMIALPENGRVSMDYFDNVTFIGDSITQGLFIYKEGIPNAKYCAYLGASPRAIYSGEALKRHKNLGGGEEIPFDALLANAPDNVYILLGTNAMVSMDDESLLAYYEELVVQLKQVLNPAIGIYVQSITSVREGIDKRFDVGRIHGLNDQLAKMTLRQGVYFVDIGEVLNREDGYIKDDFGAQKDGYHLTPLGYEAWREYLTTHTAFNPRHAQLYE